MAEQLSMLQVKNELELSVNYQLSKPYSMQYIFNLVRAEMFLHKGIETFHFGDWL